MAGRSVLKPGSKGSAWQKGQRVPGLMPLTGGVEWTPGLAESIWTGAEEFMRQIRPRFAVISGDRGFNKGFFHGESKKREMGLVEAADQAHRARGEDKCVI